MRLRRVAELAPEEAIAANPRWVAHRAATADLPEATLDDLEWADGFAFGSPTRFGLPAAQLKQFLDQTGGLWARNVLVDKVGTAFTSASTGHGGSGGDGAWRSTPCCTTGGRSCCRSATPTPPSS